MIAEDLVLPAEDEVLLAEDVLYCVVLCVHDYVHGSSRLFLGFRFHP